MSSTNGRVLALRWDDSDVSAFLKHFASAGFDVECVIGKLTDFDPKDYGAIIHLARSEEDLLQHLGPHRANIAADEWLLVQGGDEDDFHCTVQLTESASTELRAFIRFLWARANMT